MVLRRLRLVQSAWCSPGSRAFLNCTCFSCASKERQEPRHYKDLCTCTLSFLSFFECLFKPSYKNNIDTLMNASLRYSRYPNRHASFSKDGQTPLLGLQGGEKWTPHPCGSPVCLDESVRIVPALGTTKTGTPQRRGVDESSGGLTEVKRTIPTTAARPAPDAPRRSRPMPVEAPAVQALRTPNSMTSERPGAQPDIRLSVQMSGCLDVEAPSGYH